VLDVGEEKRLDVIGDWTQRTHGGLIVVDDVAFLAAFRAVALLVASEV
jgi:hypothetical protein